MSETRVTDEHEGRPAAQDDISQVRLEEQLLTPRAREGTMQGDGAHIAVIGAGPAGLVAAHILARLGYQVTVFERRPVIGGMLASGIPAERRPVVLLQQLAEIGGGPGIELRLNTTIGQDLSFRQLQEHFAAMLLAVGAQRSVPMGIAGETLLDGVIPALQFLQQFQRCPHICTRGEVAVIGGGWATLDAARQAVRAGAQRVRVFLPGTLAQLPTPPADSARARAEGILFHPEEMPRSILGTEDANVHGLRCQKIRREPANTSTGYTLSYLPETNYWYLADLVLLAPGERVDLSFAPQVEERLALASREGKDAANCCAVLPGIAVAGDAACASPDQRSLQHALTGGYEAAHLLHHSLCTRPAAGESTRARATV